MYYAIRETLKASKSRPVSPFVAVMTVDDWSSDVCSSDLL